MNNRLGYLLQLGLTDYAEAWELQRRLATARAKGRIPDTLVLLQHPHTYTLGRSAKVEHLLMSEAERAERGVSVYHVDRGGDITYHGPGQLVGYPVMYLGQPSADGHLPQMDYIGYLRQLEEVLIRVLATWEVAAGRMPGYTGVWVRAVGLHPEALDGYPEALEGRPESLEGSVKIAAIGVKVDGRGISQHGFALNVSPDLSFFEGIVPCGIHDRGVISLAQLLDQSVDLDDVAAVVVEQFGRVFSLDWRRVSLEEIV